MHRSLLKASTKVSSKTSAKSSAKASATATATATVTATARPFRRRGSSVKKEFTEKELKELKTAFELLDANQDGHVSTEELKIMLGKLGLEVDDNILQGLVRTASVAGDEIIDETEFLAWVKKIQELCPEVPPTPTKSKTSTATSAVKADEDMEEEHKTLSAAFKVFDLDGNGYITRDELKIGMETIGEPVTEEQITEFINMADTDKDGRINYEEFSRLLL